MSKTKDENGDGGKTENVNPQDSNGVLAQILQQNAQLMQQLISNQPTKVITESSPDYQERLRAEGYYDTFPKPVIQNGKEAEARGLSVQTRERAASLRPGRYIRGLVTVEALPNGGVHLKYKSVTVEDRMKFSSVVKDFADMVDQVWNEMHAAVPA